jgi:hypothetical protein
MLFLSYNAGKRKIDAGKAPEKDRTLASRSLVEA